MEKLIIEVGSTCTKVDLFDGQEINRIKTETIEFKRNYKKENNKFSKRIKGPISKYLCVWYKYI